MNEELNTDPAVNLEEGNTGEQTPEVKTFSQDDVNAIAAKESKKATEKVLKELGIEDFEGAKDGLSKFREWQEQQKTDAEKQTEQLTQLEQARAQLEAEKSQLEAKVTALGLGVNAESVDDVVALAERKMDDETDMAQAIEKVLEQYPSFKGEELQPPSGQSVKTGNPSRTKQDANQDFRTALGLREK